ncbi:hypothetical protein GQ457_07G007850 [Hibiscus cannabinus]
MKVIPNSTATILIQRVLVISIWSTWHSIRKCRPLMEEIKKLVNGGVLTQDLIQQWKTKDVGQVCTVLKGAG